LEKKIKNEFNAILGRNLTAEEICAMDLSDLDNLYINGKKVVLTERQKRELIRLQDEMRKCQEEDFIDMIDDPKKRKELTKKLKAEVKALFGRDLSLEEILNLSEEEIAKLSPSQQKELRRIQNQIRLIQQANKQDFLDNSQLRSQREHEIIEEVENVLNSHLSDEDL